MPRTLPSGGKEAEVEEFVSERLGYKHRAKIARVDITSGQLAVLGPGETRPDR